MPALLDNPTSINFHNRLASELKVKSSTAAIRLTGLSINNWVLKLRGSCLVRRMGSLVLIRIDRQMLWDRKDSHAKQCVFNSRMTTTSLFFVVLTKYFFIILKP